MYILPVKNKGERGLIASKNLLFLMYSFPHIWQSNHVPSSIWKLVWMELHSNKQYLACVKYVFRNSSLVAFLGKRCNYLITGKANLIPLRLLKGRPKNTDILTLELHKMYLMAQWLKTHKIVTVDSLHIPVVYRIKAVDLSFFQLY